MKYIKQLLIIVVISFIGELLNYLIPLPIPASIYGLIFLFLALVLKFIKLEQIEETANFLLSIMLMLFVPSAVGIMNTFSQLKNSVFQIILIVIISTFVVIITTGYIAQLSIEHKHKKSLKSNK